MCRSRLPVCLLHLAMYLHCKSTPTFTPTSTPTPTPTPIPTPASGGILGQALSLNLVLFVAQFSFVVTAIV